MTEKQDILDLEPSALAGWLEGREQPGYRRDQVLDWLYERWAEGFEQMSNLPAELRREMTEQFFIGGLEPVERVRSPEDRTVKFLFECRDGERVESVLLGGERPTFCISSQCGCGIGCAFCATGTGGPGRDLNGGEILEQVRQLARECGRLGNVVFMGMGEPLLNLEAVLPALDALTDERRFGLGRRRITVSTAGITPGIRRLAESGQRPHLALSLNSPFKEQRNRLMPVNRRYPLEEVLEACKEYSQRTGRRLMLEYVLLGGVNASADAARAVAGIAGRLGALVNLIRFNPVEGSGFEPPSEREVERFRSVLEQAGVTVTERYRRGRDIGAACGQLRAESRHATH